MQSRCSLALLIFAGLCGQPEAAVFQTAGFLSAKPDTEWVVIKPTKAGALAKPGSKVPEPEHLPKDGEKEMAKATIKEEDTKVEAVEKIDRKSITSDAQLDCVCPLGQFWHFRIKKCIDQGGWGYECGFFPAEHHKNVCQDGLVCRQPGGGDSDYGKHGATAATCVPCAAEDHCLEGEVRRKKGCLKNHIMKGEACSTVEITISFVGTSEAKQYEHAKAQGRASKTVVAEATGKATVEATSSKTVTATVTATKSATAEAKSPMKVIVDGKSVEMEVVGHGSETATAVRTATGSATETATATSNEHITSKVSYTAGTEASASAFGKSAYTHQGKGKGKGSSCVTLSEVRDLVGLSKDQRVGPFWAAKIISKGDKEAYRRAHELAVKDAIKTSKLEAVKVAKADAEANAAENAKLEAEEKAREIAGQAAESVASLEAKQLAEKMSVKKATEDAEAEARKEAAANAKEVATKEAIAKASHMAEHDAKTMAEKLAKAEAQEIALKHAAAQAKEEAEELEAKLAQAVKHASESKDVAERMEKKHGQAEATAKALAKEVEESKAEAKAEGKQGVGIGTGIIDAKKKETKK